MRAHLGHVAGSAVLIAFAVLAPVGASAQPAATSLNDLKLPPAASVWTAAERPQDQPPARDSIMNGLLIGAAIGGGLASLNYLDNECRGDPACAMIVVEGAAIGAGIGALIDALIRPKPAGQHAARAPLGRSFRPLFAASRKGVRVEARVAF